MPTPIPSFKRVEGVANGLGSMARVALVFVVVLIVAAAGLAIYASRLVPPHQTYQQVIPNDRFPG